MPVGGVRVNSREIAQDTTLALDASTQTGGLLSFTVGEDPREVIRAELYLEIDGGAPGTAGKRFTLNGRGQFFLPEVGTYNKNFTHLYPSVILPVSELNRGVNRFQFLCDKGQSSGGFYYIREAQLRLELSRRHPVIASLGLQGFNALVKAEVASARSEELRLELVASDETRVARAEFQGFYFGYDENGDTASYGWHGLTSKGVPKAYIGIAESFPFQAKWNTEMLPGQQEMAVRSTVKFKAVEGIEFLTPAIGGLMALKPRGVRVGVLTSRSVPAPFTSADDMRRAVTIDVDVEPGAIQRAVLNFVSRGEKGTRFSWSVNGNALAALDLQEDGIDLGQLEIPARFLRRGSNRIELNRPEEGKVVEVLLPGPGLAIRSRQ